MTRRFGYFVAGLGFLIFAASFLVDYVGIGDPGIQSAQLLGIQLGLLLFLTGIGLIGIRDDPDESHSLAHKVRSVFDAIVNWPIVIWVLIGFLTIFMIFFISPMFFNSDSRMFYFNRYIPDRYPTGTDLIYNTSAITKLMKGENPYSIGGHFYPPLYHIVFSPLLLIGYPRDYYVITILSLLCFALFFLIPFPIFRKQSSLPILFFITGLFSYGMQFELERGQFNIIALFITILGVYLFQHHPQFRLLAIVLWSVGAQIKVYPAIFGLMMLKDIKNWKNTLISIAGIGILNLLLLFVLGYDVFQKFLETITYFSQTDSAWGFPGNHSLKNFFMNINEYILGNSSSGGPKFFQHTALLQGFMLALLICFFLIVIWRTLQKQHHLFDPDVFMLALLIGMLIPSISIDYKLVLLAPAMAFLLTGRKSPDKYWQKIIFIILLILVSAAYSMTLVPYKFRPGLLINAFPMLYTMAISVTGMNLLSNHFNHTVDLLDGT